MNATVFAKSRSSAEASLVVARTLWYLDFEAAPGPLGEVGAGTSGRVDGRDKPGEYQLYDVFASTHDGPNLVFKTRGGYWKELEGQSKGT